MLACLCEYWLLKEHAFALRVTCELVVANLTKIHLMKARGTSDATFSPLVMSPQFKTCGVGGVLAVFVRSFHCSATSLWNG
jgi:hypothetical protein